MINDNDVIATLEELESFLILVDNGGLGLQNVAGWRWQPITVMVGHSLRCSMIIINCC